MVATVEFLGREGRFGIQWERVALKGGGMGRRKAKGFPEPVLAMAMRSAPVG